MRINFVRILDSFCGLAALLGALLVGWNALEIWYLATGRVTPDLEQPPLEAVVPLLMLGLVLLVGGWALRRWLRSWRSF